MNAVLSTPTGWLESEDAVLIDTLLLFTLGWFVVAGLLVLAGVSTAADAWRARR